MNPHDGDAPWTQQESELLRQRLLNDDIANNYLYSEEENALLIYYSTKDLGSRLRPHSCGVQGDSETHRAICASLAHVVASH